MVVRGGDPEYGVGAELQSPPSQWRSADSANRPGSRGPAARWTATVYLGTERRRCIDLRRICQPDGLESSGHPLPARKIQRLPLPPTGPTPHDRLTLGPFPPIHHREKYL